MIKGSVLDVAVDIRRGSPTFGRHVAVELTEDNAIAWDDPDLAIDWRIPADRAILSEKDRRHPRFKDFETPFEVRKAV